MNASKGKVALITIYQVPNYGSVLQTLATVEILKRMGYDCDIINYAYPNEWHFRQGLNRYSFSLLHRLAVWLSTKFGFKKKHVFIRRLGEFRKKYLSLTTQMDSLEQLEDYDWFKYTAVIAGSDQIWNPKYLRGDSVFMLSFVPTEIKKISIASSFAVATIPEILRDKYKRYLERFSNITVREDNGKRIAENELKLSINVDIILDPTLLLSSTQWEKELNLKKQPPVRPYILLYLLDYAFDPKPFIFEVVNYYHKEYGFEVKTIYKNTITMADYIEQYTDCQDACPERFLELVRYAALVVTSSFHGTAFAVNFGRPLIAVVPDNGDDRQTTLLRKLGIDNCSCPIGSDYKRSIEYWQTARALNQLRYLRNECLTIVRNSIEE